MFEPFSNDTTDFLKSLTCHRNNTALNRTGLDCFRLNMN